MKLKEFEGKSLLNISGIKIPEGKVISSNNNKLEIDLNNKILKAQILSNGRAKNGGVLIPDNQIDGELKIKELFLKKILGEEVEEILIEEKVDIKKEYYLGIIFDTIKRKPILIISKFGGIEIENIPEDNIYTFEIDIIEGIEKYRAREIVAEVGFDNSLINKLSEEIIKVYNCFRKNDLKMIEINPFALTKELELIALDCVAVIDEDSLKRHKFTFPKRTENKVKTPIEIEANKIDENDYRGVCGKTFIELEGDIGVLSSGGGGSVCALDSLILAGGKPANFTEYSGNPPAEKVEKLTQVLLKKKLNGLYIVGGRANFTQIDVTLKAIIDVIVKKEIKIPILIRRAGPGFEEAFKYIENIKKEYNLDIDFYDDSIPISISAELMVEKVNKFKGENK